MGAVLGAELLDRAFCPAGVGAGPWAGPAISSHRKTMHFGFNVAVLEKTVNASNLFGIIKW